jgi:hypothetical protein
MDWKIKMKEKNNKVSLNLDKSLIKPLLIFYNFPSNAF